MSSGGLGNFSMAALQNSGICLLFLLMRTNFKTKSCFKWSWYFVLIQESTPGNVLGDKTRSGRTLGDVLILVEATGGLGAPGRTLGDVLILVEAPGLGAPGRTLGDVFIFNLFEVPRIL